MFTWARRQNARRCLRTPLSGSEVFYEDYEAAGIAGVEAVLGRAEAQVCLSDFRGRRQDRWRDRPLKTIAPDLRTCRNSTGVIGLSFAPVFASVQKIENETFNTLKNQGYQFEHNFGHGKQHLSVIFALLMMLAFLVDQIQQLCDPLFIAAWQKAGSKRQLWEDQRALFRTLVLDSLRTLYAALVGLVKQPPVIAEDTS